MRFTVKLCVGVGGRGGCGARRGAGAAGRVEGGVSVRQQVRQADQRRRSRCRRQQDQVDRCAGRAGECQGDRPRRRDAAARLHRRAHAHHDARYTRTTTRLPRRHVSFRRPSSPSTPRCMRSARSKPASPRFATSARGEFVDVGLRNAINSDVAAGPRMLTAVHSLGSTGGHCDRARSRRIASAPLGVMDGVCNGADECRAAVRYQLKWGADVIKICASGGVLSRSRSGRRAAAHAGRIDARSCPKRTPGSSKVAAHSHGDLAARQAVEAGVDSIEHGSFLSDETLQLMKAKGTYLVPTRLAVTGSNKRPTSIRRRSRPRRARR